MNSQQRVVLDTNIVTQDRHYKVVWFNPEYDFTAIDIDSFLDFLQESL